MTVNIYFGILVIILFMPYVFGAELLKTECVTVNMKHRMNVGQSISYMSCGMHKCDRIEIFDNAFYAIAVPFKCRDDMLKKPGCKMLQNKQRGQYPDCCPVFGCVKGKEFRIVRTSPDGFLESYKMRMDSSKLQLLYTPQTSGVFANPFFGTNYTLHGPKPASKVVLDYKNLHEYGVLEDVTNDLDILVVDSQTLLPIVMKPKPKTTTTARTTARPITTTSSTALSNVTVSTNITTVSSNETVSTNITTEPSIETESTVSSNETVTTD